MTTDAAPVCNGLAMLGRRPADVTAILLTHWHNDHAAGIQDTAGRSPKGLQHI